MSTALMLPDSHRLYRYERAAKAMAYDDALTEDAARCYASDGYIAVADLLSAEEVDSARQSLSDLVLGRVPDYPGLQPEPEFKDLWPSLSAESRVGLIRKIWLFVEYEPLLKNLATKHPRIQAVLQNLLGEESRLIQDMAMLKPPFIGTEKPWHQDAAYFGYGPPEKVIGVWIALDPATAENGCMHVLPGTQAEGPTPHIHDRDCQIADDRVQVERDVIVPLAPGGALFFSSLIHHGTPPNRSGLQRWALQFHYAAASCTPLDRREHAGVFYEDDLELALPLYRGCRGEGNGKPVYLIEP